MRRRSGSRSRSSRKHIDLYDTSSRGCRFLEGELPRRCLVIKRTHPEEGVERTELRLVTYQKSGTRINQAHILMDAAHYLQERADDAEYESTRGGESGSRPSYSSTGTEQTRRSSDKTRGKDSSSCFCTGDRSKTEELAHFADRQELRDSLERLVTYFACRAKDTGDREWSVITGIAERLLFDVSECIKIGEPFSRDLLSRIKGLAKLVKKANLRAEELEA
ncbi:hypothetical protein RB195_009486 [Necator americanus]|uniref:Uncharacterized protein n=1 Tax=Necator americanus TaxID=51031 RepID=A0ABR1CTH9_NECAM